MKRTKPKEAIGPKPALKKKDPRASQPGRVLLRLPDDYPLKGSAASLKLKLSRVLNLIYD